MDHLSGGRPRFRAMVVMKSKMGELDAAARMSAADAAVVQPLVEVLPTVTLVGRLLPKLVAAAGALAPRRRPVMIDCSLLPPSNPLAQWPRGPLDLLAQQIRQRVTREHGQAAADVVPFVPVLRANDTVAALRGVKLLDEDLGCGAALRVDISEPAKASAARRWVDRALDLMRLPAATVDLVLDLGYLAGGRTRHLDLVMTALDQIGSHHGLRSTTLVSGSVPPNRAGFDTLRMARAELDVWQAVRAEHAGRHTGYGDYGVVHPVPPREPRGPVTVYPYLYYTLADGAVFLRRQLPRDADRRVPKGAAARHFLDLAVELAQRSEFAGPGFSWGDEQLDACARRRIDNVGSAWRWIAMSTSHHLAQLATAPPSP
ncbi:Beta protein [Streptoalloteichus tenebrarius]|uniref:Beta protein n=1 Tax=Streptoalloteichus tenebrarius (strain ATCC 17920 / DSM 40477 / JCM 4838 / CBS 697.72 / NBRC 16177 / NCIMB 11028 / NRRL B-12390 / A12253. 1 / ISP 5477) TaxID=1933 RepID=A0ABT1HYN6_STRSD|nr:beta family protein [Streptoalloteichus tenebrarius]MCP2260595.1 Beta protein [Streptoalloteichus tenebrarius]BFF01475.1 hypothetical protein GCM10020241_31500 [Streptoalloteichus tenebrarius]